MVPVADELVVGELDAPGGEQLVELRAFRHQGTARLAPLVAEGGADLREGVDHDHRAAAPEHELVDRIAHLGRKLGRMHEQQHVDILADRRCLQIDRLQLEDRAQLRHDRPLLWPPPAEGQQRRDVLVHLVRGDQADLRLPRLAQIVDQPRQVVFEEGFLAALEEGDHLAVVDRVGADQAEVEVLVDRDRDRAEAVADRVVLLVGEGLGIDHLEPDLALGDQRVLLQHLAHPLAVALELRGLVGDALGEIEAQRHRLLQRGEHVARARVQRVEGIGGQIQPGRTETVGGDHVQRHGQDRRHDQRRAGKQSSAHRRRLLTSPCARPR